MPGMSVLTSAPALAPLRIPNVAIGVPVPSPAHRWNESWLGQDWPQTMSNSRPSTNFVVPSSPVMSGRARVRAYHSLSTRVRLTSARDMFFDHDVTLSMTPLIVTFGVGPAGVVCCAPAYGASSTRTTNTEATTVRNLLMTASSM